MTDKLKCYKTCLMFLATTLKSLMKQDKKFWN
jgi:hypothetical protein